MTTWQGAVRTGVALIAVAVGVQAQTPTKETEPGAVKVSKTQITGEVVEVEGNHLVAKVQPGGEHRLFTVQPGQQFIVDGQPKQLSDLKPGTTLRATTVTAMQTGTDRTTTVKNGTVRFVSGNHLIVTLENGENGEFNVPADFKFTLDDNKEATVRDLRRGMRISATKVVSAPRTVIESATVVTGKAPK